MGIHRCFEYDRLKSCEISTRQNKASDKRLLICPSPPNRIKNASAWTLVQIYVFYGKKLSMIWKIYFLKSVFSWRNHSNSSKLFFTSQFISIDTFFKKSENQQLFFSRENFPFGECNLEHYVDQKIFLSREKIFSLPIFFIFPLYQNFFFSLSLKKTYRYFFQKVWKPTIIFF